MIRGYKDLIRVLELDGKDKKVEFTAYAVLNSYYDWLLNDSCSWNVKKHYEELISGVLLGLRLTSYINEEDYHLLKSELFNLVFD